MFDLKVIGSVLDQLEEERGVPKDRVIEAIEMALATAYKKEYGKKGQIIRASFNPENGETEFYQVKVVVDDDKVIYRDEDEEVSPKEKIPEGEEEYWTIFNPEQHILLSDAQKMKSDVEEGEEMSFPLEEKEGYGRIASQTAKQVIIQKIREAEKEAVLGEYADQEGEIIAGTVQRVERGNIFVDLGNATGLLPRDEQIPGERFRQGERIRAYLTNVEESSKGVFVRLSRSHPKFLQKLFEGETPELASGTVEVKGVAREPGSRSKIAVHAPDEQIDPVGSLVGQRGVRVNTVMSELGGERIDIIEYSEDPRAFIEEALSPATILDMQIDEENKHAIAEVAEDQQSLAIGKSGQNVRLAAKLTGWKIDIKTAEGEDVAAADSDGVDIQEPEAAEAADEPAAEATMEAAQQEEVADEAPEKPVSEGDEAQEEATEEVEQMAEEAAEDTEETKNEDQEGNNESEEQTNTYNDDADEERQGDEEQKAS